MAHLTRINAHRDLEVCRRIGFEGSLLWTDILGPIPSRTQRSEDEKEAPPESEYILQRLVELYPKVLPWHEFYDSPTESEIRVCVVCEGATAAATDILLVERTPLGTGRFVIVETKLEKNQDINRKVVGQVLEYAAWLSSNERSDDLEQTAIRYWRNRGARFIGDFKEEMKKAFGKEWRKQIWQTAFENLRKGNVRLLIVSDTIPEDLRLTVTFLPSNVLLSAIAVHPHERTTGSEKLISLSSNIARSIGAEELQSAKTKYFSNILLSYVQMRSLVDGYITAEAIGGTAPTAPKPVRTYEDHLEKLGGGEQMPGKALEILRAQTLATDGGYVKENQESLTFRMWGLAGLVGYEEKGQLDLTIWAEGPLGTRNKDVVRTLFLKRFPDHDKILQPHPKYGFYFHLMTGASKVEEVERLVHRIAALYEELHERRKRI